ncbi:MAG: acyl-CoA synthetase [Deltaproteobacteria bacterium]|nr:MAG: acyl-CoA synthetase [Deltaproteobacteria bacterium]
MIAPRRPYEQLAAEFRWQVPEEFNFGALIDAWATDRSRVALYWEDEAGRRERWTFWDLKQASNRFMNALAGLGMPPGAPLMVMLPRVPAWQAAVIGGLKLGALVIPCTASLRAKDIGYRARHSGARAIVTALDLVPEVEAALGDAPALDIRIALGGAPAGWHDFEALLSRASPTGVPARTRTDEPALCFYTSGTTREPKAVLHTHAYPFAHRYTGEYWLDLQRTDLHWTTSDTGWAKAAYGVLFGPWMNGVPVFMFNGRFDPERELDLLQRYEVSVFCAPPTEYRLLVKQDLGRWRLPRLRHCTGAGEPLNPEVIHAWHDAFRLLIHDGYGQTETTLLAANLPGLPIRPGSMGKPFPGHDLRVIGDDGEELPAGEVGDLALRGHPPSLFREYWRSPDDAGACRRGEWYVTGDRGRRDGDGYLWFVGRADDLIISAGYRIGPFEVESALLEHPAVVESAVVASPDPVRGEVVKAFVVLKPGRLPGDALVRELQEHVKRVTAPYKYPREIEFVDSLPKTVSGKIRRVELRERERRKKPG